MIVQLRWIEGGCPRPLTGAYETGCAGDSELEFIASDQKSRSLISGPELYNLGATSIAF
jgi:hypothetical protein